MKRPHSLGSFYRDHHAALSYAPPAPPTCGWELTTMVTKHVGSLGAVHWWTCSCGASGRAESENQAAVDLGAHLAVPR